MTLLESLREHLDAMRRSDERDPDRATCVAARQLLAARIERLEAQEAAALEAVPFLAVGARRLAELGYSAERIHQILDNALEDL